MNRSALHPTPDTRLCLDHPSFTPSTPCLWRRQQTCLALQRAAHSKLYFYTGYQFRSESHNRVASRTLHTTNSSSRESAVLEPAARSSPDLVEQQVSRSPFDNSWQMLSFQELGTCSGVSYTPCVASLPACKLLKKEHSAFKMQLHWPCLMLVPFRMHAATSHHGQAPILILSA